jgi:hypothetical protein
VNIGAVSLGADVVRLSEDLHLSHVAPLVRGQFSRLLSERKSSLCPLAESTL